VYVLSDEVSADEFNIEVGFLLSELSGDEQRILRFEGPLTAVHKVSATPAQWASFERDIQPYLAAGDAA
jgi:hypothetical protein